MGNNTHNRIWAHWIHLDDPQLVINSIREMVAAVAAEPIASSV
jgi:hypothetical protein